MSSQFESCFSHVSDAKEKSHFECANVIYKPSMFLLSARL